MKFSLNINQQKMLEFWLSFSEACLVDLFSYLPTWADEEIINSKTWYFFSKNKILEEAPVLSKNWNVDTVYRQLKKLVDKWLLEFKKNWRKDYWRLTKKIKEWNFKNSEKNPTKLGKKSELNSEKNPTYNTTIYNNTTINNINDNFDKFWGKYPRKIWKKKARDLFCSLIGKKKVKPEKIISGIEKYVKKWSAEETANNFIPHATTWLNRRSWEDEIIVKWQEDKEKPDPYANFQSFN